MLKIDIARSLKRHPPQLAQGEVMPKVPSYWLIWVLEETSRKPYHSRACWDKVMTPAEASQKAYGIEPGPNMLFYNLSPRLADARKHLRRIGALWEQATKS